MVASLLHDKVETKDGKKISLWDGFKEDEFGNLIWDEKGTGIHMDQLEIDKISNKIQGLNQVIHGRYSTRDAAVLNQYMLYRAAMQFRKWIPTAFEQRFASHRFNDRLNVETEGRYRTVGRLSLELSKGTFGIGEGKYRTWGSLLQELWQTRKDIQSGKVFSELELYNIRKQLTELAILASIIGTSMLLLGPDKKKKKGNYSAGLKFYLDQTNRINGDITNFYNPDFFINLMSNTIPLAKTANDLKNAFVYIPYILRHDKKAVYQKGNKKGENKEIDAITNLIPVVNQIKVSKRIFNGQPVLNSNTSSFLQK